MADQLYALTGKKIYVAGHRGMVGSAIVRRLEKEECEILTAGREDADLTRQNEVEQWMADNKPDAVFLAAAKVGGIHANNTLPAEFLYDNLMIATNIIHAAYKNDVEKLMFLGSSCIYPREASQPMTEDSLLTGPLEPTNEWYAIAKIAGIKMCQAYRRQHGCDFISAMPTNLYGPGDNYHPEHSHVPAALIRRFHEAREKGDKRVTVWGTGKPLREFMHVDDLADACVFLMQHYSEEEHINIGSGQEVSIANFAETVAKVTGFAGKLEFDTSRPDGTPRKLMDSRRIHDLGWHSKINLEAGLEDAYKAYKKTYQNAA